VTGRDVDHSSLFKLRYKFGRKRPTRGGKKEKPPLTVQANGGFETHCTRKQPPQVG
jgi:hypothetical protein